MKLHYTDEWGFYLCVDVVHYFREIWQYNILPLHLVPVFISLFLTIQGLPGLDLNVFLAKYRARSFNEKQLEYYSKIYLTFTKAVSYKLHILI